MDLQRRGQGAHVFGTGVVFVLGSDQISLGLQLLEDPGDHGFIDAHLVGQVTLADLSMEAHMAQELELRLGQLRLLHAAGGVFLALAVEAAYLFIGADGLFHKIPPFSDTEIVDKSIIIRNS